MTHRSTRLPPSTSVSPEALARECASRPRVRTCERKPPRIARMRTLCTALACVGGLCTLPSHGRTPKPPKAASAPTTAQILAPSVATPPDALPPAHQVYRCGNRYSPQPCAGAGPLDVSDARSAEQRAQAQELVARDQRLAAWLEAGRREREGAASAPGKAQRRVDKDCANSVYVPCELRKPKLRRAKPIKPIKPIKGASAKDQ